MARKTYGSYFAWNAWLHIVCYKNRLVNCCLQKGRQFWTELGAIKEFLSYFVSGKYLVYYRVVKSWITISLFFARMVVGMECTCMVSWSRILLILKSVCDRRSEQCYPPRAEGLNRRLTRYLSREFNLCAYQKPTVYVNWQIVYFGIN